MDKQSNTNGSGRFGGKDLSLEELFEMFPDEKTSYDVVREQHMAGRPCVSPLWA